MQTAGGTGDSAEPRRLAGEIGELLASLPGEASLTLEAFHPGGRWETWVAYRPERVYPAASLIKLPILLTALEAVSRGELRREEELPSAVEATGGAGIVEHLRPSTRLTVGDLLLCMIAVSDNAATNRVLDLIGFDRVNAWSSRLGLTETVLRRRMMDTAARAKGRENTTSPADLRRLLRELAAPVAVSPAVAAEARRLLALQQFKLGFATFLPDEWVAHKTGDLEGIFHDVGLLDLGGPVTVVYTFFSAGAPNLGEASVVAGRIGERAAEWAAWAAGEGVGE